MQTFPRKVDCSLWFGKIMAMFSWKSPNQPVKHNPPGHHRSTSLKRRKTLPPPRKLLSTKINESTSFGRKDHPRSFIAPAWKYGFSKLKESVIGITSSTIIHDFSTGSPVKWSITNFPFSITEHRICLLAPSLSRFVRCARNNFLQCVCFTSY